MCDIHLEKERVHRRAEDVQRRRGGSISDVAKDGGGGFEGVTLLEILNASVTQGFDPLLACPVTMDVLRKELTTRAFSRVSYQTVGGVTKWYRRVPFKSSFFVRDGFGGVEGQCGFG